MVRPSRRRWKQSRSWNLKSGDGLPRADNLSFWTHFRISLLLKIRTSYLVLILRLASGGHGQSLSHCSFP